MVAQLTVVFNALSFGEHGQLLHLAVRAGIVRVLIAFAMLAVIRKRWWTPTQAMGFSLLFVAATQFATNLDGSWSFGPCRAP